MSAIKNSPKIKRKGQSLVEFALVLPIFIFMILGIFDFARLFHVWTNLNYQCSRAARLASRRINPMVARSVNNQNTHTPSEAVEREFWRLRSPLMPEANFRNVTFEGLGGQSDSVRVSASFSINLFTPLARPLVGAVRGEPEFTLSAAALERKE